MAAPLPADPFPAPDPFASGFPFGDYSKGLQRYPGDLPCLRPRPRLSAPPSTAAASQTARNRAQFGDAPQTILLSNNNDFELAGAEGFKPPYGGIKLLFLWEICGFDGSTRPCSSPVRPLSTFSRITRA
jgi:hypothetical protein